MKFNKLFLNCLGISSAGILSIVTLTNCSFNISSSTTFLNNKEKYYSQNKGKVISYVFSSSKFPEQYNNKTVESIKNDFG